MNSQSMFQSAYVEHSIFSRLLDMANIITSFAFALFVYNVPFSPVYLTALCVVVATFLYCAESFNIYRSWRAGRFREMITHVWVCIVVAFIALFLAAFAFKFTGELSRVAMMIWASFTLVSTFLVRSVFRAVRIQQFKHGKMIKRVAVIGATESGQKIVSEIKAHVELGYQWLGYFEDRAAERMMPQVQGDIVGNVDEAVSMARNGEIDVLYIALPIRAEHRMAEIIARLGDTTVDVHIIPDFFMASMMHARIDHVGEIDTLSVFESPYQGVREWLKRCQDIVVSSAILCLISPLLILIAAAIKFTSSGPVLFKQDRYGMGGQKIKVWKFRSMNVMNNGNNVVQATKGDARITPVGAFLRRTSLDELPQFFNVMSGTMSVVGPRPHAVAHNEEYRQKVEFYMLRHKVKPGITGWAQVNGWRGETDTLDKMEKRVEYDLQYIKHWSFWFDVKIIFLTFFKGFTNKNAY